MSCAIRNSEDILALTAVPGTMIGMIGGTETGMTEGGEEIGMIEIAAATGTETETAAVIGTEIGTDTTGQTEEQVIDTTDMKRTETGTRTTVVRGA